MGSKRYHRIMLLFMAAAVLILVPQRAAAVREGILDTKHNLSKSGPGPIKTESEVQVCIFCHIPHHAGEITPLWSRPGTATVYNVYSSSTRAAKAGQPTGASRLCLSCHDGTIAVGALINNVTIPMAGGFTSIPFDRPSNLGGSSGRDLTNDHPISFQYGSDLVLKNRQLELPSQIDHRLKLENGQVMQCTTCHNPHTDPNGMFLVMDNTASALCISCHKVAGWKGSVHEANLAMHNAGCGNCHTAHNAKTPQRLMKESPEELNCLGCHSPTGGARDIKTPLAQSYRHDVHLTTRVHDEAESSISMQEHVECEDCHNPHALLATTSVPPGANGSLQGVKGVGAGGEMKETVSFQYEVCFKCHADKNFSSTVITRQVPSLNTRLEFSLDNPAYHPVMGPGKVTSVQSLRTDLGYSTSSVIYCTDCHNSDQSAKAGGTGPNGPHGSSYKYILIDNYDTGFYPMPYSDSNYALCYRCHSQAKLMATTSPFSAVDLALHQVHTVQKGVPCFICHDPHGSSLGNNATEENNAHLINFVTDFKIVATYNLSTKSCTSSCHSNNPRSYGEFASGAGRGLLKTRKPAQRPF